MMPAFPSRAGADQPPERSLVFLHRGAPARRARLHPGRPQRLRAAGDGHVPAGDAAAGAGLRHRCRARAVDAGGVLPGIRAGPGLLWPDRRPLWPQAVALCRARALYRRLGRLRAGAGHRHSQRAALPRGDRRLRRRGGRPRRRQRPLRRPGGGAHLHRADGGDGAGADHRAADRGISAAVVRLAGDLLGAGRLRRRLPARGLAAVAGDAPQGERALAGARARWRRAI